MATLYDLPGAETQRINKQIIVLAATPRLHYIEINDSLTKGGYIRKRFYDVEVGMAP